jgi:hypothetical protein
MLTRPRPGDRTDWQLWLRRLAAGQAAVYVTTGAWPLIHYRSFEAVTGRKRENWLVKANGAIFLGIGTGLGMAALRDRLTPDWRALAVTLGVGVVGVEVGESAPPSNRAGVLARRRVRDVHRRRVACPWPAGGGGDETVALGDPRR